MSFHFHLAKPSKKSKKMVSVHFAYTASGFTVTVTFYRFRYLLSPPDFGKLLLPTLAWMDLHKVDTRNAQSSKALDNMPGMFRRDDFPGGNFVSRPPPGGFILGKTPKKCPKKMSKDRTLISKGVVDKY